MQIWFLSNGSYSLKKCHNPFGKAIQPPPLTAKFRLNTENPYMGLPLWLMAVTICVIFQNWLIAFSDLDKPFASLTNSSNGDHQVRHHLSIVKLRQTSLIDQPCSECSHWLPLLYQESTLRPLSPSYNFSQNSHSLELEPMGSVKKAFVIGEWMIPMKIKAKKSGN